MSRMTYIASYLFCFATGGTPGQDYFGFFVHLHPVIPYNSTMDEYDKIRCFLSYYRFTSQTYVKFRLLFKVRRMIHRFH